QRNEHTLAAELELAYRPCRGDAEDRVQRHDDGRNGQRETNGRERVRILEAREVHLVALLEGHREDGHERREQQRGEKDERDRDQGTFDDGARDRVPTGSARHLREHFSRRSDRHQRPAATARRRTLAGSRLIDKNMADDVTSRVNPSAAGPAEANCASLITIKSGVISLVSGRWPAMKMTEPYAPIARAKAIVKPVSNAG